MAKYEPTVDKQGAFARPPTTFRQWVTVDGASGFKAEAGRYHLYVSLACPWAHRTLILRRMKGLEDVISVDVVDRILPNNTGWTLEGKHAGETGDRVKGRKVLREVYLESDPNYTGRITVPILYDKTNGRIVNNESAEIIQMLNSEFNAFCPTDAQRALDLYPASLRATMDEVNDWVYSNINNGVYRCGFATSQEAYEDAFHKLFEHLDRAEALLDTQRYLTGDQLTLSDVRLFTTLVRFDVVYHTHFKCNKKRLIEYPNLFGFLRDVYQLPGVKETVNFEHIKIHYYASHLGINPHGIVAVGPDTAVLDEPHDRADRFGADASARKRARAD